MTGVEKPVPLEPLIRREMDRIAGAEGALAFFAPYVRRVRRVYAILLGVNSITVVATAVCGWLAWHGEVSGYVAILGMTISALTLYSWPFIQHSPQAARLCFGNSPLPPEVGTKLAGTPGYMLVTTRGEVVDGRLFASALIPLLVMNDPFLRRLVRTPSNARYGDMLFAVPFEAASIVDVPATFPALPYIIDLVSQPATLLVPQEVTAKPPKKSKHNRQKLQPFAEESDWEKLRELKLDDEELAGRIAHAVIPELDPVRESKIRSGLHGFLPVMLGSNRYGIISEACRAAATRIKQSHGLIGASTDSIEWFTKMFRRPPEWLIDALNKPLGQRSLEFPDVGVP